MPRTEIPLTPVFTCWFGPSQVRFERRPLALAEVWRRLVASTAVGISPAMVAAGIAGFRRAGITARVIKAGVGALTFADASFDLVIAGHVLEFLSEPVAALAEMRRVLNAAGLDAAGLNETPRGLFRLTCLTAIGNHASTGIAGKELNL